MKASKAIKEAIKVFEKANVGDFRTVALMEGCGKGNDWESLTVQIGYAIDGDYEESDRHPFLVYVCRTADGKVEAIRV